MRHELRYYQSESCNAVVKAWRQGETPCVSMMTALGKALCIAAMAEWALKQNKRMIIFVPTQELVKQNYDECVNYIGSDSDIGIVCTKLGIKQPHKTIVVAMYQSFASIRASSGSYDYILIDEVHGVSNNPESTYRKIIRSLTRINPNAKIAGWTASPYRLGQGLLTNKCQKGEPLFTSICYDTSVYPGIPRLVEEGYLARIEVINTHYSIDLTGVRKSGHEFNNNDVGVKFDAICEDAVCDVKKSFIEHDIDTALIFVPNITSGNKVLEAWGEPDTIRLVSSESTNEYRKESIKWFKNGRGKRYLVNVNIYTTGFNFPALQGVVLMRATTSPGLLIQMLGRLIRPYGDLIGKVWDYGSNIERLGGIDDIRVPQQKKKRGDAPKKTCGECGHLNILSAKYCKKCESLFVSENEDGNYTMRTRAQIAHDKANKTAAYDIDSIIYELALGKNSESYIKMLFFYDNELVHTEHLKLDTIGFPGEHAARFIMGLFVNIKDYYKLKNHNAINTKTVYKLLIEQPQFFKNIKKITVVTKGNFKNIRSVEYG